MLFCCVIQHHFMLFVYNFQSLVFHMLYVVIHAAASGSLSDLTINGVTADKSCSVQFDNAWNGNWLSFCAAREVANAMIADPNKGTLLVHNGDISYAQYVHLRKQCDMTLRHTHIHQKDISPLRYNPQDAGYHDPHIVNADPEHVCCTDVRCTP